MFAREGDAMYIIKDAITATLNKRFKVSPRGRPTHLGHTLDEFGFYSSLDGSTEEVEAEMQRTAYYQESISRLSRATSKLRKAIKVRGTYA